MSVSAKLVAAVLILAGLLLVGCDSAPTTTGQTLNACDYDYSRLMGPGWQFYTQTPLEAGDPKAEQKEQQCAVLYRVDVVEARGGNKIWPVNGLVYRKDRDRPTDIHAYPLRLPYAMYLGERAVSARIEDILSGSNGSNGKEPRELIIEDKNADGVVVQASIFSFQEQQKSEDSSYLLQGWFVGNAGVKLEKDKVTVLERWRPDDPNRQRLAMRSQLAQRRIYIPRENKSYHPVVNGKEDSTRLVDPQTVDLTPLVMSADQDLAVAEYPEKLVLAFYERATMTDTAKLDPLMGREAQSAYWTRDARSFGCLVDPTLTQVYVQDVDISRSPGIPPHINNQNASQVDTVVVTSLCRLKVNNNFVDRGMVIEWQVQWDWNFQTRTRRWRIIRATVR